MKKNKIEIANKSTQSTPKFDTLNILWNNYKLNGGLLKYENFISWVLSIDFVTVEKLDKPLTLKIDPQTTIMMDEAGSFRGPQEQKTLLDDLINKLKTSACYKELNEVLGLSLSEVLCSQIILILFFMGIDENTPNNRLETSFTMMVNKYCETLKIIKQTL